MARMLADWKSLAAELGELKARAVQESEPARREDWHAGSTVRDFEGRQAAPRFSIRRSNSSCEAKWMRIIPLSFDFGRISTRAPKRRLSPSSREIRCEVFGAEAWRPGGLGMAVAVAGFGSRIRASI